MTSDEKDFWVMRALMEDKIENVPTFQQTRCGCEGFAGDQTPQVQHVQVGGAP